jgi:hypothetical protein
MPIAPDRLDAGQRARPGARRNDDVLGRVGALAFGVLGQRRLRLHRLLGRFRHDDLGRFVTGSSLGQLGLAPDYVDLVLLHQETDAAIHALRNAARALDDRLQIRRHLAVDLETVILRMLGIVKNLGRAQQRLGRNAAPVGADAGQMLALDNCGLEAKLRRPDRRNIAAGARTDDDDVVGFGHVFSASYL